MTCSCALKYREPMPCAMRLMYPTKEDALLHGERMVPCYMKVSIDRVVKGFESLMLPVPTEEYRNKTLNDVIGTLIQWPLLKIIRLTKELYMRWITREDATVGHTLSAPPGCLDNQMNSYQRMMSMTL